MNDPVINPNGRGVSTQSTSTLKDLVFNPETGDFEQVDRGSANEGDTVTKMTEDGFAILTENHQSKYKEVNNIEQQISEVTSGRKCLVFNEDTNEFEVSDNIDTEEGILCIITSENSFF